MSEEPGKEAVGTPLDAVDPREGFLGGRLLTTDPAPGLDRIPVGY